jgi:hypothetical protein
VQPVLGAMTVAADKSTDWAAMHCGGRQLLSMHMKPSRVVTGQETRDAEAFMMP